MIVLMVLFFLFAFTILWGMGGYALSLRILSKIMPKHRTVSSDCYRPTVTVMIVAHNEEKVIADKLNNTLALDYPVNLYEVLVASDNSSDRTNDIVNDFIQEHPERSIRLYVTAKHKGKTNAQNEAQKTVKNEILVMTDANSLFDKNAITELVQPFTDPSISYVCGKLSYVNASDSSVASSENRYWEGELQTRQIESDIWTITAGNGAIYACRTNEYFDFPPIKCHDGNMPKYFAGMKKRAVYQPCAVAYEKAGETEKDEFKRKVRMNRNIVPNMIDGFSSINAFQYGWFGYFYFGHRFCRYILWFAHIVCYITSGLTLSNWFFGLAFIAQTLFYFVALMGYFSKTSNRYIRMITYYCMTIIAQLVAVYRGITGQSKPTWDSAESTR